MTYILIFAGLFLIFILGVYFQGSNKSHKVRQADLKDIGIISHYKGKPFTGTTEEKNGDKTEYLNGLKHGLEIAFRNGSIYYKINYVNDHAKGSAEFFGINGNLIAQGEFDKKTIGTWTYYHNGKIFKIKENPQLRVKDLFNKRFNPIDIREENFQYLFSAKGNHKIEISNSDIIQSKTSNKFYLLNAQEAGVFDFILGIEYVYQETLQMDLKEIGLDTKKKGKKDRMARYRALSWFEDSNPELFKKLFDLDDTASKAVERLSKNTIDVLTRNNKNQFDDFKTKMILSDLMKIPFSKVDFLKDEHSKYIPNSKNSNPLPKWFKTINISEIDINDLSEGVFNNKEEYQVYNYLNEIRTQIKEGNLDFNDLLNNSNYSEIKEAREMCLNWFKKHNKELYIEFKDE